MGMLRVGSHQIMSVAQIMYSTRLEQSKSATHFEELVDNEM